MNPLMPSVLSGVFSIVVVAVGAWLVNQREKRTQASTWRREDLGRQREAVAAFIESVRNLETRFLSQDIETLGTESWDNLSEETKLKAIEMRLATQIDKIKAVEILALKIHEPAVMGAVESLEKVYRSEFSRLLALSTKKYPVMELLVNQSHSAEQDAFRDLRLKAQQHLCNARQFRGLYTTLIKGS